MMKTKPQKFYVIINRWNENRTDVCALGSVKGDLTIHKKGILWGTLSGQHSTLFTSYTDAKNAIRRTMTHAKKYKLVSWALNFEIVRVEPKP